MKVLFGFFRKRRAHAAGGTQARAVGPTATLVRRPLVATSERRATVQLRCNQIETTMSYQELDRLLAVDVQTGRVLPCALAQQATDDTSAIVECLGKSAL